MSGEVKRAPIPKHWVPRCQGSVGPRCCMLEDGHGGDCSLVPSGRHYVIGRDWLLPVAHVNEQLAKRGLTEHGTGGAK